jgi:hypothetical protein
VQVSSINSAFGCSTIHQGHTIHGPSCAGVLALLGWTSAQFDCIFPVQVQHDVEGSTASAEPECRNQSTT